MNRKWIAIASTVAMSLTGFATAPNIPVARAGASEDNLVEAYAIEERVLQQYLELLAASEELSALRQIPPNELTPEQRQRLAELRSLDVELRDIYFEFINRPDVEAALTELNRIASVDPQGFTALQDNLADLEQEAVLLYPLVLEDRLELILVTADAPPLRKPVAVSRTDLFSTILDFREALSNPYSDPQSAAQQLYA
ncbi:MAG: hypothetical protein AAFU71_14390 [Cyanobacteria bacterium J06632_22]